MKLPKTLSFIFLGLAMLLIVACTPQTVTIKFISNGGTNIENVLIEQGKELNAPEVSRPGYSLEGWYESENFDPSTKVTFPKTVTRNMTFYAKWTINSYTINYFPNNDTEIDSVTLNFGADINLPNVTKVGYTFEGWYTNESLTGNEFNLSKMPANDLNLYAKWKIRQLTITFLINEEVYQTRIVNYGETLTDIPVPPIINGKVRYWDTVDFTNITEDKDVHLLEEDAYYTVTIKDEWGHVYETLEVKHGENFVPTVTPSKEGYIFVGYNPGLSHVVVSNMDVLVVYQQIT